MTSSKSAARNSRYPLGNTDALKTFILVECPFTEPHHTVREGDTLQTLTMNDKLLAIVQDDELVKLMEMLTVMPSRNRDNAFDLSIGISSYLFRYPTLFNHKEEFTAKQKRTQQRLIQVNQNNIQEIVKKLAEVTKRV